MGNRHYYAKRRGRNTGRNIAIWIIIIITISGALLVAGTHISDSDDYLGIKTATQTYRELLGLYLNDVDKTGGMENSSKPSEIAVDADSVDGTDTDSKAKIVPQTKMEETVQSTLEAEKVQQIKETIQQTKVEGTNSLEKLYQYALDLANKDREIHGVSPVKLSVVKSAQHHADDMLEKDYYSHWDTEGVKPYVTYTRLGGLGYVGENIAKQEWFCPVSNCLQPVINPSKLIEDFQYEFMYDDAHADWGHRDNIIDPHHTHVNFGVAWDDDDIFFVQHFETNIINWMSADLTKEGILNLHGDIPSGYEVDGIQILRDPESKRLSKTVLENVEPYNFNYYEWGESVGYVVGRPISGHIYQTCDQNGLIAINKDGTTSTNHIPDPHHTLLLTTNEDGTSSCVKYGYYDGKTRGDDARISLDVSPWIHEEGLYTLMIHLVNSVGEQSVASTITLEYP